MAIKNIGILGGGQLARMSSYKATRMGFNIVILEKNSNSPAGQVSGKEFTGWVDNQDIVKQFVNECDIITLENEFIDYKALEKIENLGIEVYPSARTISLIQDKLIQKNTMKEASLPVPEYTEVNENSRYEEIAKLLGNKFLLKSRTMGYDGYGNATVTDEKSFNEGIEKLSGRSNGLMAEKFVPFVKELAIMVADNGKETVCYPVVETIQKNHICHTVIAPADIEDKVSEEVKEIAVNAVKAVHGKGIFGIELFYLEDGGFLINEMAPRPHNSGHYTIEGCVTSQFENHIRAVAGLPLGSAEMVKPVAVMVNLLGKREGEGVPSNYADSLLNKEIKLHIYGKEKSRPGRKMGHITMTGTNREIILEELNKAETIIDI